MDSMSVRFSTESELRSSPREYREPVTLFRGIPSTTYSGSLLALSELEPRMLIFSAVPRFPLVVETLTPATLP